MKSAIRIQNVSKRYASARSAIQVLDGVSFDVAAGEFVVLLGPSGCGKSTLLRILAGLTHATEGRVEILGSTIAGPDPAVGMVFQAYSSFPWLTVGGNVAFGLELRRCPAARRDAAVAAILDVVGLSRFSGLYPAELSGGMQQRLAIARTLAVDPQILLMDEPFGALDAMTRMEMQAFLIDLWHRDAKTVVFVTHDIDEAILLADRIVVLSSHPGRIAREIRVGIRRPRRLDMTEQPAFVALRHDLRQLILSMSLRQAAAAEALA